MRYTLTQWVNLSYFLSSMAMMMNYEHIHGHPDYRRPNCGPDAD